MLRYSSLININPSAHGHACIEEKASLLLRPLISNLVQPEKNVLSYVCCHSLCWLVRIMPMKTRLKGNFQYSSATKDGNNELRVVIHHNSLDLTKFNSLT